MCSISPLNDLPKVNVGYCTVKCFNNLTIIFLLYLVIICNILVVRGLYIYIYIYIYICIYIVYILYI